MSVRSTKNDRTPVRDLVIIDGCITSKGHRDAGEDHTAANEEEVFTLIATGRALDANSTDPRDQETIEAVRALREARLEAAKKPAKPEKPTTLGESLGKK